MLKYIFPLCTFFGLTFDLVAQFTPVALYQEVSNAFGDSDVKVKPISENEYAVFSNKEFYYVSYDGNGYKAEKVEGSTYDHTDFEVYDIDQDGDKDIISFIHDYPLFAVMENIGGKIVRNSNLDRNYGKSHVLYAEDFDGDGIEDLMINHGIYKQDGTGNLERIIRYPLGNTYFYKQIDFFDYDRDGDKDVLLYQIHRLIILKNDGTDVFSSSINIQESINKTIFFKVVMTVDGEKLMYFDSSIKRLREVVFNENGGYQIKDHGSMPFMKYNFNPVSYDIDGDGNEELVVDLFDNQIYTFRYSEVDSIYTGVKQNIGYSGLTFDGNNPGELLSLNSGSFARYQYNGVNWSNSYQQQENFSIHSRSFNDIDGDGFTDVHSPAYIRFYKGDKEFSNVSPFSCPGLGGYFQDYDGDGLDDYVVPRKYYYPNLGNMEFGDSIIIEDLLPEFTIFFTNPILIQDLDGDGDEDILSYNSFGNPLMLHENTNNQSINEVGDTIANSEHVSGTLRYIKGIDMDGDDILDILMVAKSGAVWLKGLGGLSFSEPMNIYDSGIYSVNTVDVKDMDYDGLPDLLIGSSTITGGTVVGETVLIRGVKLSQVINLDQSGGQHFSYFIDIDSTGYLDVIYLNNKITSQLLYPDGTNNTEVIIDETSPGGKQILVNDLNSDGKQDFVYYYDGADDPIYYLNGLVSDDGEEEEGNCPVGGFSIHSVTQLEYYKEKFGDCKHIKGNLYIGSLTNEWTEISDDETFSNLERIDGTLEMRWNEFTDYYGFSKLSYVGGDFIVYGSRSDFRGMLSLDSIMGNIDMLTHKADYLNFPTLQVIGGEVSLRFGQFKDLSGLENVTLLENLKFQGNNLESFSGLNDDLEINGFVSVISENKLQNCFSIPICNHVEQEKVYQFISTPCLFDINLVCTTSLSEGQKRDLRVYPNPAYSMLFVEGGLYTKYSIINSLGQTVKNGIIFNQVIDVSQIQNGVYILKVYSETENQFVSKKIVIKK